MTLQHDRFEQFRDLHQPGKPLLLPNAWDGASARTLAEAGHRAIATTSNGLAYGAGKDDGAGLTRSETLALARLMGKLDVLVTVDAEFGFTDDPAALVDLVHELADLGIVGINLEDGSPSGELRPLGVAVAKISAVKSAVPDVFINARTDSYWLATANDPKAESLKRCRAYLDAGADGIFVPNLVDLATIDEITSTIAAPLNILYKADGPGVSALAAAGVARISTGSYLFRQAMAQTIESMNDVSQS